MKMTPKQVEGVAAAARMNAERNARLKDSGDPELMMLGRLSERVTDAINQWIADEEPSEDFAFMMIALTRLTAYTVAPLIGTYLKTATHWKMVRDLSNLYGASIAEALSRPRPQGMEFPTD